MAAERTFRPNVATGDEPVVKGDYRTEHHWDALIAAAHPLHSNCIRRWKPRKFIFPPAPPRSRQRWKQANKRQHFNANTRPLSVKSIKSGQTLKIRAGLHRLNNMTPIPSRRIPEIDVPPPFTASIASRCEKVASFSASESGGS